MQLEEGYSLADYVNRDNDRFAARVLDLASGCWVLVAEKDADGVTGVPFEPIADFAYYMARTRLHPDRFPDEYLRLLEAWEADRHRTLQTRPEEHARDA